ncbi:MAG: NUDIX hydrolase [Pirellula sp.]|jgi:8-oxo-dGTP pyrophosphatase MutT (NUDIX family)
MTTQYKSAVSRMAPRYAYGRHRGPYPFFSHRAAVLVSLLPDPLHGWLIPLTLRSSRMADHAGQISLPGGRTEPNEEAWQTATREFEEELGCATGDLQPLRELSPLYIYASKHWVTPVAGIFASTPQFKPNPEEVAELIMLPISDLLHSEAIRIGTISRGTGSFEAPGFFIDHHFVWGATAMILAEFRAWCLNERRFIS